MAKAGYNSKVAPGIRLPKEIGNMYCASLYAGLACLLYSKSDSLVCSTPIPVGRVAFQSIHDERAVVLTLKCCAPFSLNWLSEGGKESTVVLVR